MVSNKSFHSPPFSRDQNRKENFREFFSPESHGANNVLFAPDELIITQALQTQLIVNVLRSTVSVGTNDIGVGESWCRSVPYLGVLLTGHHNSAKSLPLTWLWALCGLSRLSPAMSWNQFHVKREVLVEDHILNVFYFISLANVSTFKGKHLELSTAMALYTKHTLLMSNLYPSSKLFLRWAFARSQDSCHPAFCTDECCQTAPSMVTSCCLMGYT